MREEARMKDYPVKVGSILKFRRFDHDDYKKTLQGKEKTDDYDRIGRAACELQERLYVNGNRPMLIVLVLRGMDNSGKDATIKSVMSGVNPQGSKVMPSKLPRRKNCGMISSGTYIKRRPQRARSASPTACITRTY
jgi:polyphosphate kinase 2 (PPK2 family)